MDDDPASTRLMTAPTRIAGAACATIASAVVLATVRSGWLDAADGVVLVASLAVLARTAIRLASDPGESRHEPR